MKKLTFQANLPVTFLREGNKFVAYTPALDLSTSGDTFEQAQRRFVEAVGIFFEECRRMGTMESVLLELGWTKTKNNLQPPVVVAQESRPFSVPLAA